MSDEVYSGNSFSIDHRGGDWRIWRYVGTTFLDSGTEDLKLTTEAMDELYTYFTKYYWADRPLDQKA